MSSLSARSTTMAPRSGYIIGAAISPTAERMPGSAAATQRDAGEQDHDLITWLTKEVAN